MQFYRESYGGVQAAETKESIMKKVFRTVAALCFLCAAFDANAFGKKETRVQAAGAVSEKGTVRLFTTTSTQDSGLLDAILPVFTGETGYRIDVHSVGTGAAIQNGRDGEADVLLVHDRAAEEKFMADGCGTKRYDVMYNDFIIVGPAKPLAYSRDIVGTFKDIAANRLVFVSRADKSGTHTMELNLWKAAGIDEKTLAERIETGTGMGATLRTADEMQGYTLADRATWLRQKDTFSLTVVCEGSEALLNFYSVIPVNPAVDSRIDAKAGQAFADWLLLDSTQKLIAAYKINGEALFFPNASK
jgi:tungstate transport system substrate-binding protein